MRAAPMRFVSAALWPLTIWTSLSHLEEHPADDYVERTSPIVATAVAFWACLGLIVVLTLLTGGSGTAIVNDGGAVRWVREPSAFVGVLWWFVPVIYIIGLWLFTARDEAFPR